jgi:beta-xylosidase
MNKNDKDEPRSSRTVRISNTAPKLDVHGNIVNAHDGTYRQHQGVYYYHGAEYGLCHEPARMGCDQAPDHCGFKNDHNVSIWKSPDLSSGSWERVGTAVQCQELPGCKILYRPHLVFNPNTNLWVLFVNYVSNGGGYGGNAVYSAPSPEGPFTLRTRQMALSRLCPGPANPDGSACGAAQGGCGDFDVFVDDDGKGYIVYGCRHWNSIEPLTLDFYNSSPHGFNATGPEFAFNGTVFPDYFTEAPALFKRLDTYYMLYGHCCCFCYQGSGIMVYTAPAPMGPWVKQEGGDLACMKAGDEAQTLSPAWAAKRERKQFMFDVGVGGVPTPGQGCLYNGSTDVSATHAQQNFVLRIPDKNDAEQFLWTGDLWQQSPDGLKGHEGQYWTLLQFDAAGRIGKVRHVDSVVLEIPELVRDDRQGFRL